MLNTLIETAAVVAKAFGCLLTADFIAGVLHWGEDTWLAPGTSAFLDRHLVEPNIEHHRRPGAIRDGTYWETNSVCIILAVAVALSCALAGVACWEVYLTLLIASQSNQIHAWGHTANPPAIVAAFARIGIVQTASYHAVHHKRPYGVRYCTTTNYLNPLLDAIGFWRGLEWLIERLGATVQRATQARGGF